MSRRQMVVLGTVAAIGLVASAAAAVTCGPNYEYAPLLPETRGAAAPAPGEDLRIVGDGESLSLISFDGQGRVLWQRRLNARR
jgi:hypothetical protein